MMTLNDKDKIDLNTLIGSRMLVQANSGGGKSWLLRRLIEQTYGKIQCIVIDIEGEFYTLREQYDYLLVAKDGDLIPDLKTADKLAKKVLELGVNVILDLYELKHQARRDYVKAFLDGLINAPKSLWHPCIVIVDEAHVLCPQGDKDVSSAGAVKDLMSRGRKRGLCGVLATQRLSKLDKDAAAEAINICIGRTTLDLDVKRAGDVLGFHKTDFISLRDLKPGDFFIVGPALSQHVKKIHVGSVQTSHPKIGTIGEIKVVQTAKIKGILEKLAELPKEVQKERDRTTQMQEEILGLRHQVRELQVTKQSKYFQQDEKVLKKIVDKTIGKTVDKILKEVEENYGKEFDRDANNLLMGGLAKINSDFKEDLRLRFNALSDFVKKLTVTTEIIPAENQEAKKVNSSAYTVRDTTIPVSFKESNSSGKRRMLEVLYTYHTCSLSKIQLATLAGLKHTSGTFHTYFSELKQSGLIQFESGIVSLTVEGHTQMVGGEKSRFTEIAPVDVWRSKLNGGALRMFNALVEIHPDSLTKQQLADVTDLAASSGTFGTYLSKLRSNDLIVKDGDYFKASDTLFMGV